MKTALVTGSAGFVGRHLIPKLKAAGYRVADVDTLTGLSFEAWKTIHQASRPTFDVVVHLAANIENVDARMKAGHKAYADILLDYQMAEYVSKNPPREAFIWPTSCAVDFSADPYAWVKLTGERVFGALKDVPCVFLRPFSGYGEDQSLEYPFPAIVRRALAREDPLTVWGSGQQVRDFIHIDDLTDAFMHAIHGFPKHRPIEIGTGVGTSFMQLASMIAREAGYSPGIYAMTDKAESSKHRVADISGAAEFGFTAKINLAEGIRRAVTPDLAGCVQLSKMPRAAGRG